MTVPWKWGKSDRSMIDMKMDDLKVIVKESRDKLIFLPCHGNEKV
jgi:hypothetical protein